MLSRSVEVVGQVVEPKVTGGELFAARRDGQGLSEKTFTGAGSSHDDEVFAVVDPFAGCEPVDAVLGHTAAGIDIEALECGG